MSDSVAVIFYAKSSMHCEEAESKFSEVCEFWSRRNKSNASSGIVVDVKSPLNTHEYKLTPYIDKAEQEFLGFLVKVNIPSVTIGNNAILHTLPYHAAKIALLLLKNHLRKKGVAYKYWKQFSLENSEFELVTINHLFCFENFEAAKKAQADLKDRAGGILKKTSFEAKSDLKEGFETVYLTKRNYPLNRFYIKSGDFGKAKSRLPKELKNEIYSLSACMLRMESELTGTYLNKNYPEFLSPLAWKNADESRNVISEVFEKFKQVLRLDEGFRKNTMRTVDFEKLSPKMKSFLVLYFDGAEDEVWDAMPIKNRSELKRLIYDKTRIDVTLPWKIRGSLKPLEWAREPEPYKLQNSLSHLQPYVFDKKTAFNILNKLKEMLFEPKSQELESNFDVIADVMEGVEERTAFERLKVIEFKNMVD